MGKRHHLFTRVGYGRRMSSLLDVVRTLASPVLGPRRTSIVLRHRDTGQLFGDSDLVAFPGEADAKRFIASHACEPDAWETIPLAS